MPGAVATMAEAPQIQVPIPIRVERVSLSPSFQPTQRLIKKVAKMMMNAFMIPGPTVRHTKAFVVSPKHAMSPFRKLFEQKLIPGLKM